MCVFLYNPRHTNHINPFYFLIQTPSVHRSCRPSHSRRAAAVHPMPWRGLAWPRMGSPLSLKVWVICNIYTMYVHMHVPFIYIYTIYIYIYIIVIIHLFLCINCVQWFIEHKTVFHEQSMSKGNQAHGSPVILHILGIMASNLRLLVTSSNGLQPSNKQWPQT